MTQPGGVAATGHDELNALFSSDNPDDLIKFYNRFDDYEGILQWMRNRPHGRSVIREVEGNHDVVVVIPTRDFDSGLAASCRNIFKGLQMVFVESGADPYFNLARNCNIGLGDALKFDPDWVIVSNDDVYRIDDVSILVDRLSRLKSERIRTVFARPPTPGHSYLLKIAKSTAVRNLMSALVGGLWRERVLIQRRFKVELIIGHQGRRYPLLYKTLYRFPNGGDFFIFSSALVRGAEGKLFDETYINGPEDIDLSWRLAAPEGHSLVDFKIGSMSGSSIGTGKARWLRDVANEVYLNYKVRNGLLPLAALSSVKTQHELRVTSW